jgi:hypothetical protein
VQVTTGLELKKTFCALEALTKNTTSPLSTITDLQVLDKLRFQLIESAMIAYNKRLRL